MICVFPSDATDFASNGLYVLTPTACSITEAFNVEWELSMTHPLEHHPVSGKESCFIRSAAQTGCCRGKRTGLSYREAHRLTRNPPDEAAKG